MSTETPVQTPIADLHQEYKTYIDGLRARWLREHRVNSHDVYEVMRPEERDTVDSRIAQWARYITPFAEAWWTERGYGVIWPDDDSKPMQVYRLATT